MYKELDCIVLTTDIPVDGLKESDVGTIVHVYPGGDAFIAEFSALDGSTVSVTDVEASQIRAVSDKDITHSRVMKAGV